MDDRDEREALTRPIGVTLSTIRRAVEWLNEKAAELKLRVRPVGRHTLRTFELEIVAVGIDGKRALWAVLATVAAAVLPLQWRQPSRLAGPGDAQRHAIEMRRLLWANAAFTGKP